MRKTSAIIALVSLILLTWLSGCAHRSGADAICINCRKLTLMQSTPIPITAWLNAAALGHRKPSGGRLHVYIEGDGKDWWRGRVPPTNPTGRSFRALKLMALDSDPAAYLNRPCFGWHRLPEACAPFYWTHGRYSQEVVDQMNRALNLLAGQLAVSELVLIGYSGGGSLAMLLAEQRHDVRGVVTVAANLDHQLWTDLRGFSPLRNSLNALDVQLPPLVYRWHFAGALDRQVPSDVTRAAAATDPAARFELLDDFDHQCCWQRIWPSVLHRMAAQAKVD